MKTALRYYIAYKPFQMVCAFTGEKNQRTLGHLHLFPSDVYPVGRLDADSEGLILLTNDKRLNHLLLDPKFGHSRTYLVQVEGLVTDEAIAQLRQGVEISTERGLHFTRPAICERTEEPAWLPPRFPPVRFRAHIPTSWIALTLQEGKNRQVRKMTAKVGFPTLRLVRTHIEGLVAEGLKPGQVEELSRAEVYQLLKMG